MKPSKPAKRFGVKLHVREGKGEGHWLHVRVNGVDYEFHYTGGSLNNGNHEAYVGDGENILDVELHHADDRYGIDSGGFDPDKPSEFWFTRIDELHAEVHDANTVETETRYTVYVLDSKLGNTVPCHPMMKNVPPP